MILDQCQQDGFNPYYPKVTRISDKSPGQPSMCNEKDWHLGPNNNYQPLLTGLFCPLCGPAFHILASTLYYYAQ